MALSIEKADIIRKALVQVFPYFLPAHKNGENNDIAWLSISSPTINSRELRQILVICDTFKLEVMFKKSATSVQVMFS